MTLRQSRSTSRRPARDRLGALAVAALVWVGATACGGDDEVSSGGAASSSASSPASPSSSTAAVDPASPFVVAASAVAARSRTQVVDLHAFGSATTADPLPADDLPALAATVRTTLAEQVSDATRLPPPEGTPAAQLVASLQTYGDLAAELAAWTPADGPLPAGWFDEIEQADEVWQQSLGDLSALSGQDLLADLPALAMPSGS